jgi:hypothetical protein
MTGHAASGTVGERNNPVNIGILAKNVGCEVRSDTAGNGSRAVDGGQNPNVVPCTYTAVKSAKALKESYFLRSNQACLRRFGADGIVSFEITNR